MGADREAFTSNIWKTYAASFLVNFIFFLPIIVLFWQANGLSFTQIMVLQALFSIAVFVLELPTGFFADVYGRKTALVFSGVGLSIGALVYSIGSNFYHFLIAEIIWAVGFSLMSGTDSAFVYDTLSTLKREKTYKRVMGTVLFLGSFATAMASIIGGILGAVSFRLAIAAFIPFAVIATLLIATAREPPRKKLIYEKGYAKTLLKIVRFALIKNSEVRWLIIYFTIVNVVGHVTFWLYQPYFIQAGLKVEHVGVAFAILLTVTALSSKFAHLIENFIGKRLSLLALPFLSAAALLLMALFVNPFSIVFVAILSFVFGFSRPVVEDYINRIVWADKRATVMSLNNMGERAAFAIIAPLVGLSVDKYGINNSFLGLALISLIAGLVLMVFLKKNKVI